MNQFLQDTLELLRNKCLLNMYVNHSYWFSSQICLIEMKWFPMAYYGGPGHGGMNGHYYHVFGTVRNLPVPPHDSTQSCVAPILSSTIECDGLKSCILSLSTCNYTDVNVEDNTCSQILGVWPIWLKFLWDIWRAGMDEWNHVRAQNREDLFDAVKKVGDADAEIYYSHGGSCDTIHWDNFWILWIAYPLSSHIFSIIHCLCLINESRNLSFYFHQTLHSGSLWSLILDLSFLPPFCTRKLYDSPQFLSVHSHESESSGCRLNAALK